MANTYLEEFDPIPDGTTEELGDLLNTYLEAHNTGVNLAWKERGAWDENKFVKINDIYTDDGKRWLALQASHGVAPVEGASWALVGGGGDGLSPLFVESEEELPEDAPIGQVAYIPLVNVIDERRRTETGADTVMRLTDREVLLESATAQTFHLVSAEDFYNLGPGVTLIVGRVGGSDANAAHIICDDDDYIADMPDSTETFLNDVESMLLKAWRTDAGVYFWYPIQLQ